jgi:hypothetical protein
MLNSMRNTLRHIPICLSDLAGSLAYIAFMAVGSRMGNREGRAAALVSGSLVLLSFSWWVLLSGRPPFPSPAIGIPALFLIAIAGQVLLQRQFFCHPRRERVREHWESLPSRSKVPRVFLAITYATFTLASFFASVFSRYPG